MIVVPAMRINQFGVEFYQATLSASDVDRLVRFESLSYGEGAPPPERRQREIGRAHV